MVKKKKKKKQPANAGDIRVAGWIPGSGKSPGGGYSNPLQYSCLENPTEKPGRPWSIVSQRVGHNSSDLARMQILSELLLGIWAHFNRLSVSPFALHFLFHPTETSEAHSSSCLPNPNPPRLWKFHFLHRQPTDLAWPFPSYQSITHSTAILCWLVQRFSLSSLGKRPCHFYFHFARYHVYSQHCMNNKIKLKVKFSMCSSY